MTSFSLREWLGIRPGELRRLWLAVLGAFFLLAFLTLVRSLREALFLSCFEIRYLPWLIAAVVVCGLPAVGLFGRWLGRSQPAVVLTWLGMMLAAGIIVLWPLLANKGPAIVVFYLWTAVGALLLASGFWLVVAEQFPLRGAKRLFGLIGAGGTAGAMLAGTSLSFLTHWFGLSVLALVAAALLLFFLVVLRLFARAGSTQEKNVRKVDPAESGGLRKGGRLVLADPYLRTVAGLVFFGTLATCLLDYRFKDLAIVAHADGSALVAFLGAFYGWAGGVALFLQVVIAGRFFGRFGVTSVLLLLPVALLLGGVGMLLLPGLLVATLVRGTDYSMRKSLYRSAVELLYVPVSPMLRRRAKTCIDTVVDSLGDGLGAVFILLWLGPLGLRAEHLVIPVVLCALATLILARRLSGSYRRTVGARLQEEASLSVPTGKGVAAGLDLLGATFTSLDLRSLADGRESGTSAALPASSGSAASARGNADEDIMTCLSSPDHQVVMSALSRIRPDEPTHIEAVARLMARDRFFRRIIRLLQENPTMAIPRLIRLLSAADTDFVIRRRIPEILAGAGGVEADEALLQALTNRRFEVRYRAAVALVQRRKLGLPGVESDRSSRIWDAVSREVSQERSLWELQRLLDEIDLPDDNLVIARVGARGELSLEHTFRLLSLVLDAEQVQAAYHGVILDNVELKSFALEYLEQVLPQSIRNRLWLFIGDFSESRRKQEFRPLDAVVADLMVTGQTVFGGDKTQLALRNLVDGDRFDRWNDQEK